MCDEHGHKHIFIVVHFMKKHEEKMKADWPAQQPLCSGPRDAAAASFPDGPRSIDFARIPAERRRLSAFSHHYRLNTHQPAAISGRPLIGLPLLAPPAAFLIYPLRRPYFLCLNVEQNFKISDNRAG